MRFKRIPSFIPVVLLFAFGCGGSGGNAAIIINHNNVDASVIPSDVITRIKGLDVYFEHASVGGNIAGGPSDAVSGELGGLDFLAASNPNFTITHEHASDNGAGPLDTTWIDSNNGFYDNHRGNPGMSAKVSGFNDRMRSGDFANHVDVAMFKFCWIDADASFNATDAFNNAKTVMENLEEDYPNTTFVWWTMPIMTSAGSDTYSVRRDEYNNLVRNYCSTNGKILFDLADIECHSTSGLALTDAGGNEALDSSYASDVGHLNQTGATRIANAWWVLLARICGWNP